MSSFGGEGGEKKLNILHLHETDLFFVLFHIQPCHKVGELLAGPHDEVMFELWSCSARGVVVVAQDSIQAKEYGPGALIFQLIKEQSSL